MEKIVKSKEQISKLIALMEVEDNEGRLQGDERKMLRDLREAAQFDLLPMDDQSEAYYWLTGLDDTLGKDYGIE